MEKRKESLISTLSIMPTINLLAVKSPEITYTNPKSINAPTVSMNAPTVSMNAPNNIDNISSLVSNPSMSQFPLNNVPFQSINIPPISVNAPDLSELEKLNFNTTMPPLYF